MTPLVLVLAVGAAYRITLLIVADHIADRPRDWLLRRWGPLDWRARWLSCSWCMGIWVAFPVVVLAPGGASHGLWLLGAAWMTVAAAVGVLARVASPD